MRYAIGWILISTDWTIIHGHGIACLPTPEAARRHAAALNSSCGEHTIHYYYRLGEHDGKDHADHGAPLRPE